MVQRYLLQGGLIGPHDDGDWVGYEDYANLEALYAAAVELMVSVHRRYNADVSPALEELYEKVSHANEPSN